MLHHQMGRDQFAHALDLYFGGDMESSIALSGQVAGRIDNIQSVAQIMTSMMSEFYETLGNLTARYTS